MPHSHASQSQDMQNCIQDCLKCYSTCLETIQHCLMMGGKHAEQQHITLMLTCARICETCASAMLLGSAQHVETCRACAAICRACAEDCRDVAEGDETMTRCADECEQCAASCERMAGAAA